MISERILAEHLLEKMHSCLFHAFYEKERELVMEVSIQIEKE